MNIINLLGLKQIEINTVFLLGSYIFILFVMIAYFRRVITILKGLKIINQDHENLKRWIDESEAIYTKLIETLQERRTIAEQLISQLDLRINTLKSNLQRLEDKNTPIIEEYKDKGVESQVILKAKRGLNLSEIAKETGLSIGEIELILNLKKSQIGSSLKFNP